ncbi:hypothetical protein HanRHA438_Chr12g0566651 [Helianthus annuus]|nr:hypothetical protein HanRHA438_Chr12g0566651 [Helianthus annuus]
MLKSHKGVDTQTEMPKCKGLLNGCTSHEGSPRRGDRRPRHKLDCTGMLG